MVTFGLDISHHQDARLDLAQCAREGIEFAFLKATEGGGYEDPEFRANLLEAEAAGLLVAAYHYVRASTTAAAQVDKIRAVVPLEVPVILDVEENSGDIRLTRELVTRLEQAGYRVPLLYLPRWYWTRIGSPSLSGLPPLWSSRYPDNVVGSIADEWDDVPSSYWDGYGGRSVAVLQFTSSARIAGHQPIDANAFRGNRSELAALLGYADGPTTEEDDPMFQTFELPPTAGTEARELTFALPWQGGSGGVNRVWGMLCAGAAGMIVHVAHWQRVVGNDVEALPMVPDVTTLTPRGRTAGERAPADVHALIVNYTAPMGGSLVIEAAR